MKKFMFAAMAALAITSCSQNEEFNAPGKDVAITFGSVVNTSSRASLVTTGNIKEFTVDGYKTADKMLSDTKLSADYINGEAVTKNTESNLWESNTFYWPLSGKVQFFATSPAQTLNIDNPGYPKFDYTVGAIADQKDLIAANLKDKDKSAGNLIFAFKHLLTQVNFSIKGDTEGFTYKVTGLKITGVKDKATFTFDGEAGVGAWTGLTASTSPAEYTYAGSATVASTTVPVKLEAENTALFMLMPQVLSDAEIEITYSAAPTNAPTEYTFNGTKKVALTGTWTESNNVRYTLKLTSDASVVSYGNPTTGEWVSADQPEIVTPKE